MIETQRLQTSLYGKDFNASQHISCYQLNACNINLLEPPIEKMDELGLVKVGSPIIRECAYCYCETLFYHDLSASATVRVTMQTGEGTNAQICASTQEQREKAKANLATLVSLPLESIQEIAQDKFDRHADILG